jgi:hypothetical protein
MARKRIGELLVEGGAITREQLEAGLTAQKHSRQRLGVTLVLQGVISEGQLAAALATSLELPVVDLAAIQVDWSAVHMLRARFCESNELFPFGVEGKGTPTKRLLVALSDPLNTAAIEEIEFTTGLKVAAVVGTLSQVRQAILRYYHKGDEAAAAQPPRAGAVTLSDEPVVSVADLAPPAVVAGTLLDENTADPGLEQLIEERAQQAAQRKKGSAVSKDLEFLFGREDDDEPVEKLERKFWALMRIMARKGLISREEFLKEVEEE